MASPTQNSVSISNVNFSGALVQGTKWGGATGSGVSLTYSFPTGTAYSINGYGQGEFNSYVSLTLVERDAVGAALQDWSSVANISFTELPDNSTTVGELRFARTNVADPNENAHAYYPSNDPSGGDVWFKHTAWHTLTNTPIPQGSYDYLTILHEIGHALGLRHSFEGSYVLPTVYDNYSYTVMSYAATPGGNSIASFYPTTPMWFDLVRMQEIYGRASHNSGDTVYVYNGGQNYWETIDDAHGNDTIQYNGSTGGVIDLATGHWSQVGNPILFKNGSQLETVMIGPNTFIENAIGGIGNDLIYGNELSNSLFGRSGNDEIYGMDGSDLLYGEAGRDDLRGGNGSDLLWGGDGDDLFVGGSGSDVFTGGIGRDEAAYQTSAIAIEVNLELDRGVAGDAEGDRYGSIENIIGSQFSDSLTGDNGDNYIYGLDGNDRIWGGTGNDLLIGGDGADILTGGSGVDAATYHNSNSGIRVDLTAGIGRYGDAEGDLFGSIENIIGTPFNDDLFGDNADNQIWGQQGNDDILGGTGNDRLDGGAGNDRIWGEAGMDMLFGGANEDELYGGADPDQLNGGDGNDILDGGAGLDLLTGGMGADRFVVASGGSSTYDTILDFSSAQYDRIDLRSVDANSNLAGDQQFSFIGGSGFSGSAGQLRQVQFGPNWLLQGDLDGNGAADFFLVLNVPVTAADFYL